MKKIYTLSIALLSAISSFAYYDDGKLAVTYLGRGDIRVTVDGRRYDGDNDNTIMINNLRPGYHTVKIFRYRTEQKGGWRNANNDVLYSSSVYVRPQTFVDITINRFGKPFIDEQQADRNGRWEDDDDRWNNGNCNRDDDWRDRGNRWDNNYNNGMRNETFEALKQTLSRESFDDKKLMIAKQAVRDNGATAAQVKELLQQFAFENNKLDLAKYAYQYVSDRKNYFVLYDSFTFNSNKDELARYIQNYR